MIQQPQRPQQPPVQQPPPVQPQQFIQRPYQPQQFIQQPPPQPQQFIQQPVPRPQSFIQQPPVHQQQAYWNWAPQTAAPLVATTLTPIVPVNTPVTLPFTLPPPPAPTQPSPKLLAHNTARMIREIATFSDHHHGANEDYGAVQTLMEAFFEAIAGSKPAVPAQLQTINELSISQDSGRVLQPLYDGTEMGANRPLVNKLFESDMVLTVEQMKG
ncbi:unnamed protein product [Strongylus vulgaris]|uniref:Uncharacterized protein n=1 Tax=Strongylus vulgaris TaxID=40348 RepID=A0A3P7JQS0_STRVU|nr:unnamed protein product [Strongylus vulgaris]